jgi:hypothetical protein
MAHLVVMHCVMLGASCTLGWLTACGLTDFCYQIGERKFSGRRSRNFGQQIENFGQPKLIV